MCTLGEGSHFVLLIIVRSTVESVFQPCRILNGQIQVAKHDDVTGLLCLNCTYKIHSKSSFKEVVLKLTSTLSFEGILKKYQDEKGYPGTSFNWF